MDVQTITTDRGTLSCLVSETDANQTLIFLHGAGSTREVWDAQWRFFKDRVNVIVPDLPGHGGSPGPVCGSVDSSADVVTGLARRRGTGKYILIGHSMGGAIAQKIAIVQPELIAGLVLIATGARLRVMPQVFSSIETDYKQYTALASSVSMSASADEEAKSAFTRILARVPAKTAYTDFAACDRFDVMKSTCAIRAKTLIIAGDSDMMTPLKYAVFLNEHIPDSQLVTVAGAGHMVMMEKPSAVNAALDRFVTSLGG